MVMNKKKQVFGVVEKVEENKDYTGVKTKTANVTVDNTSREISVDVDFSSMLGETNQTAYPGHLGAQTRRFVLKAMDDVSSETDRATEAEKRLEELIADTAWDIDLGDSEVKSKLYDEINRSKLAEKQLQLNIDNLSKSTDSKFNNIQNSIDNLSEEVTKQDNKLELKIIQLQQDAQKSDELLQDNINKLSSHVDTENKRIEDTIDFVKQKYAEKTYVYEKLVEFTKLSKQVVDYVDENNNVVIIEGSIVTPVDGIIYLVKDSG